MCPSEMTSRLGVRIMCWSGMTHHKVTCFQDVADKLYCFAQSNNHLIRGKQPEALKSLYRSPGNKKKPIGPM
jgi:hypothetical protein